MNILQKLVTDEIERRRASVEDADQRLTDAKAQLDEARVNAKRIHEEYDELRAWLEASKVIA